MQAMNTPSRPGAGSVAPPTSPPSERIFALEVVRDYVVFAIWAVELAWSPLWLAHFQYGPMQWLWRSLTRWQLQAMRRIAVAGIA